MTKIKNFRINLRPREIARYLRNRHNLPSTPALDAFSTQAIQEFKPYITPASIYTTLTRATADKTTALPLPNESVAVSLIAVTIGDALPSVEVSSLLSSEGVTAEMWREAIQHEALQQSIQFAVRLLQEQAKEESCDMTPTIPVPDAALLPSLGTLLGVERIGIRLENSDSQLPSFARLVWSSWTPLAKPSRRGDSSSRKTERAAV